MALKLAKKNFSQQEIQNQHSSMVYQSGAKQIQRMIKPKTHLWLEKPCICTICQQQKPLVDIKQQHSLQFRESSKKSHEWLKKILLGLTQKMTKGLKLFIPDILFIVGDGLQIFSTNKKDYRIMKYAGTTPLKAMVHTMTRLRKQYKGMLEQNYKKTLIDKIDPKFMHVKYFNRLLPSHFHDGDDSRTLSSNKSKFRTYVLGNNDKFIIPSIEEHKMNDKQPFATIRYSQGNYQLLNQKEFQLFSLMKLPQDVVYIQAYIKSKQAEAIVFSSYNSTMKSEIDSALWKRAQLYVMVLLGGLGKYDDGYDQLQNFQDQADQIMKLNPQNYAKLLTYQIIHFLSMASKLYITHLKIKWIINDIDNLYLQEIIEFQTEEISQRQIRYKLPPTTEIHNFYSDSDFFIQVHMQLKKKKQENLIRMRKTLQEQNYEDIVSGNTIKKDNQTERTQTNLQKNTQSVKNNLFRRVNKRRTISILDNQSFVNNKMSIDTKDTTFLMNSQKFSTIGTKRTQSHNKNVSSYSHKDKIDKSRRSISVFGDVITRYEQKMIDKQKRKLNKSMNRYQVSNQKLKKSSFVDFQIHKTPRKSLATIDFQ